MPKKSAQSFGIYNPGSLAPEVLLEEFIARKHQLEQTLEIVRNNEAGSACQQLLVLGPRGMGKTMLLLALSYRVERDPELSQEWLPVIFPEETYGIGDLADFWLFSASQLLGVLGKDAEIDRVEALRDENPEDIEDRARTLFLDQLAKTGKRALLVLENLDSFFDAVSDEAEQHRLRAFLMESDQVMIAASAPSYFDATGQMEQPFYDFFRTIRLERFEREEMVEVLSNLAELRGDDAVKKVITEDPGRIDSLRVLTGGNPRLIKMIYRLLSEGGTGTAREDLDRLLEDCTPYFKHRIEEISGEERRVFDHVARHWDPVTVGDIQKALRRPSNRVSIYLRRLMQEGFIEEAEGSTAKKKSYQVAERFYNIYYLMRFTRSGKKRLSWLIAGMRALYSTADFEEWTRKTLAEWKTSDDPAIRSDREAFLYSLTSAAESELQKKLIDETLQTAWDADQLTSLGKILDRDLASKALGSQFDLIEFFSQLPEAERSKIGYEPNEAKWWYYLTWPLEDQAEYSLAEEAYRRAIELDPKYALPWNGLGNLLQDHLGRYKEAEEAYHHAIQLDPKDASPWNGLGNVLKNHLGHYEQAEEAHRHAIELDPKDALPWNGLGNLLQDHLGRYKEAEEAYRRAIKLDPKFAHPYAGLSSVYSSMERNDNASQAAIQSVILGASFAWPRSQFLTLCANDAEAWEQVLPAVLQYLTSHDFDLKLLEFCLQGFTFLLSQKALDPADVITMIEDNGAQESLADTLVALRSIDDPGLLKKTSPERRAFAKDFLARISNNTSKTE